MSSYASNNPFSALPDGGDSSWASVGRNGAAKSLKVPSSGNGAVKSLNGSSSSNGGARVAQNVVNSEPTKVRENEGFTSVLIGIKIEIELRLDSNLRTSTSTSMLICFLFRLSLSLPPYPLLPRFSLPLDRLRFPQ